MQVGDVIALGYRYPTPSSAAELTAAIEATLNGGIERHMRRFVDGVGSLSLGEWEELHTATLDLSPLFVPYVGHVVWGENYRRGEFMADLKGAMADAGVDLGGELPDHIEPVLRYLGATREPRGDLIGVLPEAVSSMRGTLDKAAPDNPYRHLLAATDAFAGDLPSVLVKASDRGSIGDAT
ncbi:MAG: nitrate reductase [Acidimicrobiia bacterium]|nr:nitrate reductase [Acidimicrobiia bacterium]